MPSFTVRSNQSLTSKCEDKSIFHTVLVPESAGQVDYQPGDWLVAKARNQPQWAEALLKTLNLKGDEPVEVRRVGLVSAREALTEHLEISQLNPAILNKVQRQYQIGDWADRQAMMAYAYGRDILDLLEAFPLLSGLGVDFLSLLAPLAPRYYSIASAPCSVGNEVHLLVKQVVYHHADSPQRTHYGVASYAISRLAPGDQVEAELKSNPMFKLPDNFRTPVIMIGSGTGLAPFVGFMQQRAEAGAEANTLFFGETHRQCAFLFESELVQWQSRGQLKLFTAFSRDQAEKVYVQDRLWEQREVVWAQLEQGAQVYLCGSQFGLAQAVQETFEKILCACGGMTAEEASNTWLAWRKSRHLQLDVY